MKNETGFLGRFSWFSWFSAFFLNGIGLFYFWILHDDQEEQLSLIRRGLVSVINTNFAAKFRKFQ